MELMPHQQRIVAENPRKALLNWEMRVGKGPAGAAWLALRCGPRYVVCPKQLKKDWVTLCPDAVVLTKEEFKKVAHEIAPVALVIDEAHYFASPLFLRGGGKKRSALAEALYTLVRRLPEMDILLLTATPVRNDAWSLHTLLCYIGVYYDWKWWRETFFELKPMPYLPRQPWMHAMPTAWVPRNEWRRTLRPMLEKHTDIMSLADIVDYLPPATSEVVKTATPPYVLPLDKVVTWTHAHQWEQQGKAAAILALGYKKVIVVAHYTEQIDALSEALSFDKPVFVLDGRTKDADEVKRAAQAADECYFIVQASMGFGFDGYMFGAIVFASMSHSCVHHTQMLGRARSAQHLQPVTYIYLIGGTWDRRIYDCVMEGRNFDPHAYEN